MEYTEVKYIDGKKFSAQNRTHNIIIDQPKESGGEDEGPTPPELFVDALGSCIGVYVLAFCKNTGLDPSGMKITLEWEKSAEKPARIKSIKARIGLPNASVGSRGPALLKVAESCLVHETIKHQPLISISLA